MMQRVSIARGMGRSKRPIQLQGAPHDRQSQAQERWRALILESLSHFRVRQWSEARDAGQRALAQAKRAFGKYSMAYGVTLGQLAHVQCHLGDYHAAEDLGLTALGILLPKKATIPYTFYYFYFSNHKTGCEGLLLA